MKQMFTFLVCFCLFFSALSAQNTLTGNITDQDGEVLVGVNVVERGTTNGTISDIDGNYSLRFSGNENATITFSYVGHTAQSITLEGQTSLDVVLSKGLSLDGIEVVGSRSQNRTVTESPVAIDLINLTEITNDVGQLDVNQLLQYAAPSFNANRQSGADGADHIDPATLRGLGPDQTLVLINGKRRHQSSLINIFGSRGRGNTGTDLNAIPVAAIERIEILRDGASAQYGSDAIAGVINIVLKSSTDEFSGSINAGVRNAKAPSSYDVLREESFDGQSFQVNGNYGVKVGKDGFINVTADYLTKAHTNRAADPAVWDIYREKFGDAAAESFGTYFNARVPLINEHTHFYAFGGFNYRDTDAFAWTRSADSDRNVPEIYPNGFNPHITSRITDKSMSAGIRSKIRNWDVDFNNTFGANRFHYAIEGTLNASLGAKSPTRFDAGGHSFSQNTTGLSFSRYFADVMAGMNLAFGTEYRIDNYGIFAGEEGSYRNYGVIDSVINGVVVPVDVAGLPAGSQGFPGLQPSNELNEYRSNIAAYADAELDVTEKLMFGLAARFENYSDFGETFNMKLAGRYEIMDALAVRASVSTGFRAPSLAQVHYNTTFTDFVGGEAIDKLIAPNNSSITRALGIPALKEEVALNASFGFTAKAGAFTATVDGYYVDIQDRIVLTGSFGSDDPDIGADLQALNVGAAQFFTNAIDTRTIGADLILTYSAIFAGRHRLRVSVAGNFNSMELGDITTSEKLEGKEDTYFGQREQYFLLASAPASKINLSLDYKVEKLNVNLRFVRFDKIELIDWLDTVDTYDAKITTDLTLGYDLSKNLSLNIGGANIFNVYPTQQDTETETGGLWDSVQMGTNGAFYFTKLGFKF